jgi:SAM-dependent methyltransferase
VAARGHEPDDAGARSAGTGVPLRGEALARRLQEFPDWLYEFDLGEGVRTPVSNRTLVNRQHERRRYFFDALLRLTGGSLAGRRVLDLGCGAGYWSLAAVEAGADFVLGIDAKPGYLEQARVVFEAKGVQARRFGFELANAVDADPGRFDVVLCLGLLSFVTRPLDLLAAIARAEPELVVIDTEVSRERLPLFELARPYRSADHVEHPFLMVPSPSALAEVAAHFGLHCVALAPEVRDWTGMGDYRRKRRLAFICSRAEIPAGTLPLEPPRRLLPWWLRDPGALREALL